MVGLSLLLTLAGLEPHLHAAVAGEQQVVEQIAAVPLNIDARTSAGAEPRPERSPARRIAGFEGTDVDAARTAGRRTRRPARSRSSLRRRSHRPTRRRDPRPIPKAVEHSSGQLRTAWTDRQIVEAAERHFTWLARRPGADSADLARRPPEGLLRGDQPGRRRRLPRSGRTTLSLFFGACRCLRRPAFPCSCGSTVH